MSVLTAVPNAVNGLDLSSIQDYPKQFDAVAIKKAGFDYAYVQSSRYSSTREVRFQSMVDRLHNAGLRVGAYHFCSHVSDPEEQAMFFYKASGGLGSQPGELPPMVDWEFCTPSVYKPPTYPEGHPTHCVQWAEKFCNAVANLWWPNNAQLRVPRLPTIYSYPNFCAKHQPVLGGSVLGKLPLTLASYRIDGSVPSGIDHAVTHSIPDPWKDWTICQYSGTQGVPVPGIVGPCDRQCFNGTRDEFDTFCGL